MTKRKRTPSPSPSPPPRGQVFFQIPASLQRLSRISRSLACQSDKLAGLEQDDQNAHTIVQEQALRDRPTAVAATPAGTAVRDRQGRGFRAFAPHKQPSFPDTQTWVEPKPQGTQIHDAAGFMPLIQPSFPQRQTWPETHPRKVIPWPQTLPQQTPTSAPAPASAPTPAPGLVWVPPPMSPEAAPPSLEAPPKQGETLCLETQPHRIAALIAQKLAANEANRKREAWARQAAAHRMSSQAPDDQLRNELNSALGQSSTNTHATGASTGERQALRHPEQYVTPTAAITFDPVVPSVATLAASRPTAQTKKGSTGSKEPTQSQKLLPPLTSTNDASSNGHDSLFSPISPSPSPADPPKPSGGQSQRSALHPNQHDSFMARLPAAASTAPSVKPKAAQTPASNFKPQSNSRHAETSFVRQPPQSNHAMPVAAGYYRFSPRHWQTSSTNQQQQQSQALTPATQSSHQGMEMNAWPASHDVSQKITPNPVFRNLTQDKFGRFGVGGKLREAVGQQSAGETS